MRSNRLQLNYDKTEVLWCTTGRRQHQLPTAALLIDGDFVSPTSSVRDMGIYTDADLGRMSQKVARCFAVLRQLRRVRHCVTASTFQSLYGSTSSSCYFTAGLRQQCHDRPPCLSDEAATDGSQCRCVADLWPSAVLPHLGCAHHPSLASHSRAHQVQYVAVLTYNVLHGRASSHLGPLTYLVAEICNPLAPADSFNHQYIVPPSAAALFRWLALNFGTLYRWR